MTAALVASGVGSGRSASLERGCGVSPLGEWGGERWEHEKTVGRADALLFHSSFALRRDATATARKPIRSIRRIRGALSFLGASQLHTT